MSGRAGEGGTLRRSLLALLILLPTAVIALALVLPACPAAAASLTLRVGLVWDRWAVEVGGKPGTRLSAGADAFWPGQGSGGAAGASGASGPALLPDGARYAVSASVPGLAAAAAESPWLVRAAAAAAAAAVRAGGRDGTPSSPPAVDCTTVRLGGLWYARYAANEAPTDLSAVQTALRGQSLPAFGVRFPAVPSRGGQTSSPCAVFLDGLANGLSLPVPVQLSFSAGGDWTRVQHERSPYRGRLEILAAGTSKLYSLVNVLDIEDYLLGVVPSEMPAAWPLEALKAQAVAARTYAVSNLGKHSSRGFDLCDDIHCQAYLGYSNEYPGPTAAVRATSGLVATHGGRLINAVYHAHAGGATDSSAVIWGAAEPYLAGTSQTYEKPYYWTATNRRTEVEAAISSARDGKVPEGLFPLLSATPSDFTPGGRARTVLLTGPSAESSIGAGTIRSKLGSYRLRSDAMWAWQIGSMWLWPDWPSAAGMSSQLPTVTWAPGDRGLSVLVFGTSSEAPARSPLGMLSPEFFVFSGEGFGHGVGMSQWGAREMAAAGKSYRQILGQFYKGIAITPNYGR